MRPFLRGFTNELIKLGGVKVAAFPQQSGGEQAYDSASSKVMDQTQGTTAKTGLKAGQPMTSASAVRRPSPTPLTTPNAMVDVASKSGGAG